MNKSDNQNPSFRLGSREFTLDGVIDLAKYVENWSYDNGIRDDPLLFLLGGRIFAGDSFRGRIEDLDIKVARGVCPLFPFGLFPYIEFANQKEHIYLPKELKYGWKGGLKGYSDRDRLRISDLFKEIARKTNTIIPYE